MEKQFEQFIRERKFIVNASPKTLDWYRASFKSFGHPEPTQMQVNDYVMQLRERGLKASSVNTYGRAVNAYLHWSSKGLGKCGAGCAHLRVLKLKEPQLTLPTYKADDIKRFIRWKPKRTCDVRLQVLVLLLMDCGLRISEALGLRWSDVNMDDLLLTVHGKGGKDRTIPFSFELRKHLARYQDEQSPAALVFHTRCGLGLNLNNMRRDVRRLCERLGFTAPERTLHAIRHTFAVNYIRRGGSILHLQKVLGHSTLEMSKRYVNLSTEDLQAVHEKISLLSHG